MGTTIGPPPIDATIFETMEHCLRTAEAAKACAKRSHTVEPAFGDYGGDRS